MSGSQDQGRASAQALVDRTFLILQSYGVQSCTWWGKEEKDRKPSMFPFSTAGSQTTTGQLGMIYSFYYSSGLGTINY